MNKKNCAFWFLFLGVVGACSHDPAEPCPDAAATPMVDAAPTRTPGGPNATCGLDSPCMAGLVCDLGSCRSPYGGSCNSSTPCQTGLACVDGVCQVGGPDGGMTDAGTDAGIADTGVTPPTDTGTSVDSGTPPADTGLADTGTMADTGTPPVDSGPLPACGDATHTCPTGQTCVGGVCVASTDAGLGALYAHVTFGDVTDGLPHSRVAGIVPAMSGFYTRAVCVQAIAPCAFDAHAADPDAENSRCPVFTRSLPSSTLWSFPHGPNQDARAAVTRPTPGWEAVASPDTNSWLCVAYRVPASPDATYLNAFSRNPDGLWWFAAGLVGYRGSRASEWMTVRNWSINSDGTVVEGTNHFVIGAPPLYDDGAHIHLDGDGCDPAIDTLAPTAGGCVR